MNCQCTHPKPSHTERLAPDKPVRRAVKTVKQMYGSILFCLMFAVWMITWCVWFKYIFADFQARSELSAGAFTVGILYGFLGVWLKNQLLEAIRMAAEDWKACIK